MDVHAAKQILVAELERILELPDVEAQAELQQLLTLIDSRVGSEVKDTLLDDLEEMVETEIRSGNQDRKYQIIQDALKRIQ